jgi:replicative DNA helicase
MPQDLKIPPHSLEAEESVLGALLMDKDAIVTVAPILQADHFYETKHQKIYAAILMLYEEREPIDLVTVAEALKKNKALKKIGGKAYLTELLEKVPTAAHAEHYAKIVRDHAIKRELISSASRLVAMSFDEAVETRQILDFAEQQIFSLSQRHLARNFIPIKDALTESFDRLDELQKSTSGLRGVPTGFTDLDNTLAGMQMSNLLILAGRPGLGKTALALNIAQFAAVKEKLPVGFFSLEMSKEELVDRLLVSQAEIDAWRLKTGRLDNEDFSRLSDAMGELAEAPLFIDDSPGISVMEMRTKARRLQVEQGLKLLIVDYLQLAMPSRRWESRVQEVSEISQNLKNLARELKIPVLALSQLSRAVEARGTKVPQLADLRESGAIEQDADVVMFLYREDEEDLENVTLSVAKHRNGPLRTLKLRFRGERIKFYPMEEKRKE